MDLSKYQELTGITVSSARKSIVTATIKRVRHQLEQLLGYPLAPSEITNLYNEEGQIQNQNFWIFFNIDTITENLLAPDPVIGSYRLFDFNWSDKYIHLDPYTQLNKVKLVYNDVTIKSFDLNEVRKEVGQGGLSKYIEVVDRLGFLRLDFSWQSIQLAVDATWLADTEETIPYDLLHLWAEMVTFYSDPKQQVQQEQIGLRGGHHYTKYAKEIPEDLPRNKSIINQYSGPYGSVTVSPTVPVQPHRSGQLGRSYLW